MYGKKKNILDVKETELSSVVHPNSLSLYCQKLGIKYDFELQSGMAVLVVDRLPTKDSIVDGFGAIKRSTPFNIRSSLSLKGSYGRSMASRAAGYRVKEPEPELSVFEALPPLSTSVVEYEKKHGSQTKDKDDITFELAWMQVDKTQPQALIWADLFTAQTPKDAQAFIKECNAHLNEPVRQGEIVVIPTTKPRAEKDKTALRELMEDAEAASKALKSLSDELVATCSGATT